MGPQSQARTVERLNKKAAENLKNFAQAAQNKPNSSTVDDEPNQRLLEALKSATIEDKKVEKKGRSICQLCVILHINFPVL